MRSRGLFSMLAVSALTASTLGIAMGMGTTSIGPNPPRRHGRPSHPGKHVSYYQRINTPKHLRSAQKDSSHDSHST